MRRQIKFLARAGIRGRLSRLIHGRTEPVQGWVPNPDHESSDLSAPSRVWLTA